MIKSNELRIGNKVEYFGEIHTIQTVGQWCHTDLTSEEIPLDQCKSISLTEEWLLKFGSIRQISYQGKVYDCHGIQVYETDDDGWHLGNEETHLEIESVHQLQNLYFALKGEELKIK